MNFWNKIVLAPMVRASTLPMRTLALRYGADLVYTDEMIDVSLLNADRRINESLETVDYISKTTGDVVFRASPNEKQKLVFQMGTATDANAVKVAKYVQDDVSAIDINMGCPKPFSCDFGMGAALLEKPERAKDIVRALVKNVPLPITCKIRILPNIEDSVKLVKDFESIGVSAIAVHGRLKEQQSEGSVNKDAIRRIVESVRIPVIANGASDEINCYEDAIKFRDDCGAASVMLARAAQKNISIFRKEGLLDRDDIIREYLKVCVDYDNTVLNTKYAIELLYSMNGRSIFRTDFREAYEKADKLEKLCAVWNLREYCQEKQREHAAKGHQSVVKIPRNPANKLHHMIKLRRTIYASNDITLSMLKSTASSAMLMPKKLLQAHAERVNVQQPAYNTEREGRFCYSVVEFMGKRYSSLIWDAKREAAEQNSALVCMHELQLADQAYFQQNAYAMDIPSSECMQ